MTDLNAGLAKAKSEDKYVLLNFHGPDIISKKLHEEIFDRPEFITFAQSNFVLVEIDFSGGRVLTPDTIKSNAQLARTYEVQDWPVIFVLDKNGKKLARGGYMIGGPEKYIAQLKSIPGFEARTSTETSTNAAPKAAEPTPPTPAPASQHEELTLKGIFFGKQKTALINDQTLGPGETAKVTMGGKKVQVECKEIRPTSVIVQVEDEAEPRELKLKPKEPVK